MRKAVIYINTSAADKSNKIVINSNSKSPVLGDISDFPKGISVLSNPLYTIPIYHHKVQILV